MLAGNAKLVSSLIEQGADVNARDTNGDTPLHLASRSAEKMEIVSLLIEGGANINVQDEDGDTPLHDALFLLGNTKLASFLIEKGADASIKNKNGKAPFHFNSFEKFATREAERIRSREKEKQEATSRIRGEFEHHFAEADSFYEEKLSALLPRDEYEKEKNEFVREWVLENTLMPSDEDQSRAIAEIHGNIQLVARAGSGKTSTLINRALFMIKHCQIPPEELLLLAFNKKAVLEMRRRLLFSLHQDAKAEFESEKKKLTENSAKNPQDEEKLIEAIEEKLGIELPHVMTFHALAHAIVKPEETLIYDDPQSKISGLSNVLQQVIDEHIRGEFQSEIKELMLAHFKNDWKNIVVGGYEKDKEEFLKSRRSLAHITLKGERVESTNEKLIADFLFEHDIPYKYRRQHWLNSTDYGPCFIVLKKKKADLIVRLAGNKNPIDTTVNKDLKLIELSRSDVSLKGTENFRATLENSLQEKGIQCNKLSEDEVWDRIKDRAIDRFTKAVTGFINKCRQFFWTEEELKNRISAYLKTNQQEYDETTVENMALYPSSIESHFLKIAQSIYSAYLERLSATKKEDFNGLIQRAVGSLEIGNTQFTRRSFPCDLATIRYMFIDEFQDFSELFRRLVSAIKGVNKKVEMFCVGDNWQAINGFAGSDLVFFENFDEYFDNTKHLSITTNYRSQSSIVEVTNVLMDGLGSPARPHKKTQGPLLVADLDKFELQRSKLEEELYNNNFVIPAVLRLVQKSLKENRDVALLSRLNEIQEYKSPEALRNHVCSRFSEEQKERISVSTVHKYKGLEEKTVIILDAVESCYPLIHQDWIFTKIFGDNLPKIIREEQRLFYVAMTRAIDELIIITHKGKISPFLERLIKVQRVPIKEVSWDEFPPVVRTQQDIYWVKVGNQSPFEIKDRLKESGYRWYPREKSWTKKFPIKKFSLELLKSEKWSREAREISVKVFDETETDYLASYKMESGKWMCEFDRITNPDLR